MNLLDKNWPGLLIVVALAIFSCEDAHDIGLGLDPDGVRVEVLYAELPLEATNVRIDSIKTSNDSRFLIGKNVDPTLGTIRSVLYSQLNFTSSLLVPDGDHRYVIDSTVINFNIDKVHTSDNSRQNLELPQHFDVYQLTDTLFSASDYLSGHKTPYRTDKKEGSFDLVLNADRVRDKDSLAYLLQYRLNDDLGEEIFAIATLEQGSSVSPIGALRYEYKGIAIVGDEGNNVLLGIKPEDSTNITVHYHEIDRFLQDNVSTDSIFADSLELVIGLNTFFYNDISTDRTGTLLSVADDDVDDYSSFTAGDGNVYLQPASGIFPKLNLDTLSKFFDQHENIQINRLEFVAEAAQNEIYNDNVQDLRYLYTKGPNGSKINTTGLLSNILFETAVMTDNGYLARIPEILISNLDESTLTYEGYPTFFGQLVETGAIELDHMIVMPQDMTSPDFSVFDEKSGFRIRLYYTLPQ